MGGGDKGSATPTTPPLYQGGSIDNYTPPATSPSPVQGFDWSAFRDRLGQGVSQGFQSAGARLQGGAGGIPSFAVSQPAPTATPTATPEAMQRIIPEMGAGKYFYVDPKAGATSFDPMDYYNQNVSDAAATEALKDSLKKIGLLGKEESATPSF